MMRSKNKVKRSVSDSLNNPWALAIASLIIAAATFLVFRVFIVQKTSSFAAEIAAAFLGTGLTVVITATLLRHETAHKMEAELKRETDFESFKIDVERNEKIYDAKLTLYREFFDLFAELLHEGKIGDVEFQKLRISIAKMALVADKDTLEPLHDLSTVFHDIEEDEVITPEEFEMVCGALDAVATAFGRDLREKNIACNPAKSEPNPSEHRYDKVDTDESEDSRISDYHENEALAILSTISFLPKTTEAKFLAACSEEDRSFYSAVFSYCKTNSVQLQWRSKGVFIRSQRKRPLIQMYPSGVSKPIHIVTTRLPVSQKHDARCILDRNMIEGRWSFEPGELSIEEFKQLLRALISIDVDDSQKARALVATD